jgi:hypothetical protein
LAGVIFLSTVSRQNLAVGVVFTGIFVDFSGLDSCPVKDSRRGRGAVIAGAGCKAFLWNKTRINNRLKDYPRVDRVSRLGLKPAV